MNQKPKIVTFDIESALQLAYCWGPAFRTRISPEQVITPKYLLGFSWKWLEENKTHQCFIHQGRRKNLANHNDYEIVLKLWEVLDEADIVITYNGANFDVKLFNTMCMKHGLTPPSPYQHVDLIKTARSRFRFDSNKLDEINKFLGYDGKHVMKYQDWIDCYNNDLTILQKMADYCDRDVEALEQVYIKFQSWIHNHPNMSVLMGDRVCPKCGSEHIKPGGWTIRYANGKQYRRVICKTCGAHAVDKNEHKGSRKDKALIQK